MKKIFIFILAFFLMIGLCGCSGTDNQTPKTTIAIDDLKEGTYIGTMSGDEYTAKEANTSNSMTTSILPADIKVTIENDQIKLYCKAIASSVGKINGKTTPQSPEFDIIITETLPLKQSGDIVIAKGDASRLGENMNLHYKNGKFDNWEKVKVEKKKTFSYNVSITMKKGQPVANITLKSKNTDRTADVTLSLK